MEQNPFCEGDFPYHWVSCSPGQAVQDSTISGRGSCPLHVQTFAAAPPAHTPPSSANELGPFDP